jgi:hypothetical protein
VAIILPALIGALSGSFGGNFVSNWLKKREEKDRIRKDLTNKYLIQLQYIVQSFYYRLYNMKVNSGAKYMNYVKGNSEYYIITTLYSLGSMLADHRILLVEGIYSQMEYIYPKFGSLLITKFDEFGFKLDRMSIINPDTNKRIKFFRYDRMLLGDVVTEENNGTFRVCSYKKFKDMYESDDKVNSSLSPAREFVENLPFSSSSELDTLMVDLNYISKELEQKTAIHIKH